MDWRHKGIRDVKQLNSKNDCIIHLSIHAPELVLSCGQIDQRLDLQESLGA